MIWASMFGDDDNRCARGRACLPSLTWRMKQRLQHANSYLELDEGFLHYHTFGISFPVLLLQGGPRGMISWFAQVPTHAEKCVTVSSALGVP